MKTQHYVYEGKAENFATLVLENSKKGPVLASFWAEWAGPCHRLFPVLLSLAQHNEGKFLLVTINTDTQKTIAERYAVKSLPLVKIFKDGVVVEETHGYQSEASFQKMINRYIGKASDEDMAAAINQYQSGDIEGGLRMLAEAALEDPDNPRIPALLGKLLMAHARYEEASQLLQGLPVEIRNDPQISPLILHLGFILTARSAPEPAVLQARLATDPEDAQARYQLSAISLVNDDYQNALTHLMALVENHPQFNNEAGRKGMVAIFKLLNNEGELVQRFRPQLYRALH